MKQCYSLLFSLVLGLVPMTSFANDFDLTNSWFDISLNEYEQSNFDEINNECNTEPYYRQTQFLDDGYLSSGVTLQFKRCGIPSINTTAFVCSSEGCHRLKKSLASRFSDPDEVYFLILDYEGKTSVAGSPVGIQHRVIYLVSDDVRRSQFKGFLFGSSRGGYGLTNYGGETLFETSYASYKPILDRFNNSSRTHDYFPQDTLPMQRYTINGSEVLAAFLVTENEAHRLMAVRDNEQGVDETFIDGIYEGLWSNRVPGLSVKWYTPRS